MRLKSIQLAGFKSFVDPTTVPLPTNLTAIVGPNGCGKSNIIDAVRWVMGESSAKQLRGESLDDVIFNGSTARKPVGQASIELCFDNSDHSLVGQFASYTEIVTRREITRDGQSNYYLNGTRCRRRDIVDIFLGTGLGPRSYAIIEQGTISRIIEAKPEELRSFIEEAAGISKYKERRHETQLRIHHTEENLARVNDIREELTKQLSHLQRQATAAERYKVLKHEEHELRGNILAIRWKTFHEQSAQQQEIIADLEKQLATKQESILHLEEILENQRKEQEDAIAERQVVQEQYYQISNEASQIEQTIKHQNDRIQQWKNEFKQIEQTLEINRQHLQDNSNHTQDLEARLAALKPQIEIGETQAADSKAQLHQAELAVQALQGEWESFNRDAAQTHQQIQIAQTRIQHLEQHMQTLDARVQRLQTEHNQHQLELSIEPAEDFGQKLIELQAKHGDAEADLSNTLQAITDKREANKQTIVELDRYKNELQSLRGKHASLIALQEAALGRREEVISEWLKKHNLFSLPRLAEVIQAEQGWENAIEVVLDSHLQAVCIDSFADCPIDPAELPLANISLISKSAVSSSAGYSGLPTLLSKVHGDWPLAGLLDGIYLAENVADAQEHVTKIAAYESIVTRDGVWMGQNWMYVPHKGDATSGVLQRERELTQLKALIDEVDAKVEQWMEILNEGQTKLHSLEHERELIQRRLAELVSKQAEVRASQQVREGRLNQLTQRNDQIHLEIEDCKKQLQNDKESLDKILQDKREATQQAETQKTHRETLSQAKIDRQTKLDEARKKAQVDQDTVHQSAMQLQASQLQLENLQQNAERMRKQLLDLEQRQNALQVNINDNAEPLQELQDQQQALLEQRQVLETKLAEVTQAQEKVTLRVKDTEHQRHAHEQSVQQTRNDLEQARLHGQSTQVRNKSIEEQIVELGYQLEHLLTQINEDVDLVSLEETLAQTTRKIERLGNINLAAIDECATLAERKEYLDKQYTDLQEALALLHDAISTMDKETRTRFKETYDKANDNFQTLFPKLFGGGKATLQLNDDDILTAGVSVIAQPPGKRNSSIHLLSGGEKALTAVALVFSLFQLNPAPFCMLDEVDAPLDDANVVRFCNLVKEMSAQVQFIFISHNKLAIEMAQQLTGVTMQEAGVSRMVAVDVEEAIALAAA